MILNILSYTLLDDMSAKLYNFAFSNAGNYGGVRLSLHREALQDVQGQEVPLHADGVLPGRRALDHPQVSSSLH